MSILNIGTHVGERYLRFQASTGSWLLNKLEINLKNCVLDHESTRSGWGSITEGSAPNWQWDPSLGQAGPQPSPDHKRGFSTRLWIGGYGWAIWNSNSIAAAKGLDSALDSIWAKKDHHPGKLPVLICHGSKSVGQGNNQQPIFELSSWVSRDTLGDDGRQARADVVVPFVVPDEDDSIPF